MVRSSSFIIAPVRGFVNPPVVKTPGPKLGVGWSFSGAELPWIHPWGLVVGVHATLGDQQDGSSQNQDGASHVQDRGAHAAGEA